MTLDPVTISFSFCILLTLHGLWRLRDLGDQDDTPRLLRGSPREGDVQDQTEAKASQV